MSRMSTDDATPATDWTRYGEPIDIASPNDSRALVVGLVGAEPVVVGGGDEELEEGVDRVLVEGATQPVG